MTSIRARLSLLLLAGTALVWLCAMLWIQASTRGEVERVLDARLAEAARMVASLVADDRVEVAEAATVLNDAAPAILPPAGYEHRLSCQIWALDGGLVARSDGAPEGRLATGGPGYSTATADGTEWRVYTVEDEARGLRVMVGDSVALRERLVADVTRGLIWPAAAVLPVLALLIWATVGGALAPLARMADGLAARGADDLGPLPERPAAREVRPVAAALDALFARVARARERERSFTAYAAHELKTPLAGIKAQARLAAMAPDAATRDRALDRIAGSVDRTDRLVRQLLDLSAIDAGETAAEAPSIPLDRLAAGIAADLGPRAMAAGVTVDLRLPGRSTVPGPARPLLAAALRNLIENAIDASPRGGTVEVVMEGTSLVVLDTGPGLSAADRARATERFWTGAKGGSGLGLAIVEASMERLGGGLALAPRPGGGERAALELAGVIGTAD